MVLLYMTIEFLSNEHETSYTFMRRLTIGYLYSFSWKLITLIMQILFSIRSVSESYESLFSVT